MRIPRVLGGVLVAGVLSAAWLVAGPGIGVAGANCSGPQIEVSPTVAGPGTRVTVIGTGFGTACNDTGGPGPVLGAPARDVALVVRVEDREKQVGTIDVADDYDFVIDLQIPPSLGTGAGAIEARYDRPGGLPVSAPIEVSGPPGDAADWPVLDLTSDGAATDPASGIPWAWVLVGATGGAVVTFGVGAAVRARRSGA